MMRKLSGVLTSAILMMSCAAHQRGGGDAPSMVALCEAVLDGKRAAQAELAQHPLVKKMSRGMRPQVVFAPEEYAAAAFASDHDERFSWKRLRQNAPHVRAFALRLAEEREALIADALGRATELLEVSIAASQVTLHLVCGGPWDAYVLIFEKPELFFDLGWNADRPPKKALVDFKAILTHELWHLAFLEQQRQRWPADYRESADPHALFFYRMLNEGVGHYYSMHYRLWPRPSWPDFAARAARAFALLEKSYPRYLAEAEAGRREKILWSSHAGVPFWEKWSAVPGALMVHALVRELGLQRVKALLAREPFSAFLAYDELCARRTSLPKLPATLVTNAREALARHRARVK